MSNILLCIGEMGQDSSTKPLREGLHVKGHMGAGLLRRFLLTKIVYFYLTNHKQVFRPSWRLGEQHDNKHRVVV